MGSEHKVEGEIVFPGEAPEKAEAVYIRLEDVSYSDAPSRTVAEEVLRDVRISSGGRLSFALTAGELRPTGDYSVRIHVDVNGDGQISPGDFVSVQSHPVLTYGRPNHVTITLRRV